MKQKHTAETIQDTYRNNPRKACQIALRQTRDMDGETRMEAIDKLLGNHGVEAIRGEWQNGYWCDIVATYSNTGDTYALTVMCIRPDYSFGRARFIISSWGDWVEANQEKYAIA